MSLYEQSNYSNLASGANKSVTLYFFTHLLIRGFEIVIFLSFLYILFFSICLHNGCF